MRWNRSPMQCRKCIYAELTEGCLACLYIDKTHKSRPISAERIQAGEDCPVRRVRGKHRSELSTFVPGSTVEESPEARQVARHAAIVDRETQLVAERERRFYLLSGRGMQYYGTLEQVARSAGFTADYIKQITRKSTRDKTFCGYSCDMLSWDEPYRQGPKPKTLHLVGKGFDIYGTKAQIAHVTGLKEHYVQDLKQKKHYCGWSCISLGREEVRSDEIIILCSDDPADRKMERRSRI